MRKIVFIPILLFAFAYHSVGQVTKAQSTKLINEYIEKLQIDEYLLYNNPTEFSTKSEISSYDRKLVLPESDAWLYFLDMKPLAGWSHPCAYLYVDIKTGAITEKASTLPPKYLNEWDLLTEIKEVSELKSFDFKSSSISTLKSGLTPDHCYAVIISGGYDSSPLDLDGDGDDDIQFSATRANITSVFNTLSGILDNDDYLFIFTTDHGDTITGRDAFIYLWNDTITDAQFATEVNKVNAGEISIVMEQCFSGGFVDDLSGLNRVIATACDFDEPSCGMGYYTYDEFVFDWIAAIAGEDPDGNAVDADDNNDGFVSMQEAFDYAEANDACSETPQYDSNKDYLGENLTLLGYELCITENVHNETINSDRTIENCNVDIDNVTIQNNANVVIDADNGVIIQKDFEVKVGSTLEIK